MSEPEKKMSLTEKKWTAWRIRTLLEKEADASMSSVSVMSVYVDDDGWATLKMECDARELISGLEHSETSPCVQPSFPSSSRE